MEKVEQVDREVAAACARYFGHDYTAIECATGEADSSTLVQLLARHRTAAQEGWRERIWPLVVAVEDFINEPRPYPAPEPMEVRDYRHQLYRVWSKLCAELSALSRTEGEGM